MRAYLFPGQGSEAPEMGGALLTRPGPVRDLLAHASKGVGCDLADVVMHGDPLLHRTEVSQPALAAICIGIGLEWTTAGWKPDAVAGHSVGELAAFAVAGCLDATDAVELAIVRGRGMNGAAKMFPGGMTAIRVRSEAEAMEAVEMASASGHVEIAAHNGPEEWVLTGDRAALARLPTRWPAVPLPVAGPWHSRHMAAAAQPVRKAVASMRINRPNFPLVTNRSGALVTEEDDLAELLIGQLVRPVRWAETMATLAKLGVDEWVTIGPGRVLRGLVRANAGLSERIVAANGAPPLEDVPL